MSWVSPIRSSVPTAIISAFIGQSIPIRRVYSTAQEASASNRAGRSCRSAASIAPACVIPSDPASACPFRLLSHL